ncbi:MAG: ABC transporter substrate-binding protein [Limnohabitans sp.]
MDKFDSATQSALMMDRRSLLVGASALGLTGLIAPISSMAQDKPKKGGTLRMGLGGGTASDSLDPLAESDAVPFMIGYMLYNNLFEVADDGSVKGELVESWDVKPGAADWTLKLRNGVTFTSGKALDADDVIYSLNLHRGETKSGAKVLLADVTDIKKISANQVQILMKNGNLDLPYNLCAPNFLIVPNGFKDWKNPNGTGAFTLEDFNPGVRASFKRKAGEFWKANRGNFDRVEVTYINDPTARVNALISNQVDVINRVPARTAALLSTNKNLVLSRSAGTGNRYGFAAQTDKGLFANKDLLLSMKYGIDRKKIVENVFSGYASVGNDHTVGAKMKFYDKSQALTSYDPDKAAFHFKKSGITSPIELMVSDGAFNESADCGQIFQGSLTKAGIKLELKRVSGDGYWDNVWMKVPFCATYWNNLPTVDIQLSRAFANGAANSWNETRFDNADFNRLMTSARVEMDEKKRAQMYAECQSIVRLESGLVCFAVADYLDGASAKLKGLSISGRYDLADLRIPEKGWFA